MTTWTTPEQLDKTRENTAAGLCLFGHELAARAVSDPGRCHRLGHVGNNSDSRPGNTGHANDIAPSVGGRAGHPRRPGTTPTSPTSGRVHRHSYGLTTARRADGRLEGRPARGIGWPSRDGQKCRNATFCPDRRRRWGSGLRVSRLEMPNTQLAGRMLVGGSGVNSGSFRTGDMDADGWRELERAAAELSALPVYLNDRANTTMGTIRSQCKAMARRDRCGMVIIDYLQLLDTASRNTNSTREREIAAASRSAKLLAKELDVPGHLVVAVVAQGRGADR